MFYSLKIYAYTSDTVETRFDSFSFAEIIFGEIDLTSICLVLRESLNGFLYLEI